MKLERDPEDNDVGSVVGCDISGDCAGDDGEDEGEDLPPIVSPSVGGVDVGSEVAGGGTAEVKEGETGMGCVAFDSVGIG